MKYSEFLSKSAQSSMSLAFKDSTLKPSLYPHISQPSYLEELTEPSKITIMQSVQGVHVSPRYEHHEQLVCSIDGLVQTKLVPHVYRQEVYAGGEIKVVEDPTAPNQDQEPRLKDTCAPNESPVNFFEPDYNSYPLYNEVERKYTVILHEGDCAYIPAFYFHQFMGRPPATPTREGRKPMSTIVVLEYKAHS
jgi:hypothetical protein